MSLETPQGRASVVAMCQVFGLSRAAYYEARKPLPAQAGEDAQVIPHPAKRRSAPTGTGVEVSVLRAAIQQLADDHPAWGVRKVHASLRRPPYGHRVSRKRVWALMKDMGLCFQAGARPAETPRGQVIVDRPNRRWATDLTTVWTKEDGLVAVAPLIDCGCRSVLELRVMKSQESAAVLAVVGAALCDNFDGPWAVPEGLELRTDHGPQYTGEDCRELCDRWKLDHTLAPVGRPTGNAVVERVIRTMKEECIWLRDWTSLVELQEALDRWRATYNQERPHQALGWQTPAEVRASHLSVRRAA